MLSKILQTVRFVLRVVFFALLIITLASCDIIRGLFLYAFTGKKAHPNNTRYWGQIMARCMAVCSGTHVVVSEGQEYLDEDISCIFISNHQSSLDLVAMFAIWPKNTCAVAKRSVIFMPVFGLASYLNGTIFINRSDREGAKQQLNERFKEMLPTRVSDIFCFQCPLIM